MPSSPNSLNSHTSPNLPKLPVLPSQEDVDAHMATHIPFRSWCPHCVRGKSKGAAHKRAEKIQKEMAEKQEKQTALRAETEELKGMEAEILKGVDKTKTEVQARAKALAKVKAVGRSGSLGPMVWHLLKLKNCFTVVIICPIWHCIQMF